MYPRSAAFDAAVIDSHVIATKCEVYSGGSLVQELLISDGNINVEYQSNIRRRCTIDLMDYDGTLTPASASGLLSPLTGNEIRLYRGITLSTGPELIPQGVFGISDFDLDDSGENLGIRIEAFDRSRKVSRAKLTQDYDIPAGTNYGTAIQNLISSRVSGLTYNFVSTPYTTPHIVLVTGDDPWEQASKMAQSIGMDLYFDVSGNCVLAPVMVGTTAVWSYTEGPNAMFLYVHKRYTDEEKFNHIIVTGESSSNTAPVRGEAIDDIGTTTASVYYINDSSSATLASGPYGDVVNIVRDSSVTTVAQARDSAQAILQKILGTAENLQLLNIVHPAHDVLDVIYVSRADSKVNDLYVIDKLTLPMSPGRGMDLEVRRV